jgi:hypothetical protein
MSDYSINSISSVRPAEAGVSPSRPAPGGPAAADAAKFSLPAPAGGEAAPGKPGAPAPVDASAAAAKQEALAAAQEKAASKPVLPVKRGGDVAIRFRVDRQTNNVTVFIVDRVSKRVLRSIPPEEVGKLHAGDLLELTG